MSPKKLRVSTTVSDFIKNKLKVNGYEFLGTPSIEVHPKHMFDVLTSRKKGTDEISIKNGAVEIAIGELKEGGYINEDGTFSDEFKGDFSALLAGTQFKDYRNALRKLGLVDQGTRFDHDEDGNLTELGKLQKDFFEDLIRVWHGKKPLRKWET
jgi:hypothetical protein